MSYQLIEIKNLEISPLNARKTVSKKASESLKASILAHGLMQNLSVYPGEKGKHLVFAGGRRLAALHALQKEGGLPDDYAAPCIVYAEDKAREMSLAENAIREAMHPADEFEAFAELVEAGSTAADIAMRFGTTERHVLQRLKLGRVAPELLAAYRAEKLSLESLMAFTVTDDRKRQMAVWKSLKEWERNHNHIIRDRLTEKMLNSNNGAVKFVGLDAYRQAGGTTREDLFGDRVYIENSDLLLSLASDKLQKTADKLKKQGWGWVEVAHESDYNFTAKCGRIRQVAINAPAELLAAKKAAEAEAQAAEEALEMADDEGDMDALWERQETANAKLEEIEDQLAEYADYDPEQKKLAGCYVTIGHEGKAFIESGLVKPEDKKRLAKQQGAEPGKDGEVKEQKPKGMPMSLLRDLEAYRLQAAQVEMAMHPEIAFDLLVFNVACDTLDMNGPYDGPDVHFRPSYHKPSIEAETEAATELGKIEKSLPLKWLKPDAEAERFAAFRKLSMDEKLAILAYCTALTLKPGLDGEVDDETTAYIAALSLTKGSVAAYWRPTKDNYLSRITSEQLLSIGKELLGDEWIQRRRGAKKGELVALLHQAFAEPEKHGKTAEQIAHLKNWLPAGMAFAALPEPRPAKAKKSKKAA